MQAPLRPSSQALQPPPRRGKQADELEAVGEKQVGMPLFWTIHQHVLCLRAED